MYKTSLRKPLLFVPWLPLLGLLAFLQGCASLSRSNQDPPPPATLTITTTSLPAGQINVAYSTKLAATGGSSPFTWTLTSGALPTGLQLNASTGAIAGTPTVSVTNSSLTFQVKDSSTPQQTKSVSLTLTIAPATLTITTTSLPAGQINVAYSTKLAATGGSSPFTWTLTSGALPTGLQLNASTGAIAGTPTVSVTNSSLTFQVKDSSTPQQTKSVNLTLTIAPATLTITTTSLPAGQINVAYSTKLAATGGSSPFTWTLTSGALPTGLQLNASTGAIAGTPTVSVTNSSLTFQVKDSSTPQQTKSVSLTLTIAPATLTITTTSLPAGQINVAYSTKLAATGGSSPFTWTLTSGALPTGLQLNASTGAIAGTPTVSVTNSSLTFQVKDSSTPQQTKSVNLTLTIAPATLTITTTSLPAGQINVAYSTKLAATGGSSPFTWTLTSGALPTGLQLNASTGAIAGTPTVSVTNSSLTFQVKDSSTPQQTKSVSLTLTIAPATLTITTTSLPAGQINVAYSTKLAATGGSSPFTWTLTSGALPTGLQLNASTGAIAGTPTVSVTNSSLTFQVKDSSTPQQTKSVSLTLTIAPATLTITTTSLPAGQINVAYSTKLAATGGSSPFTWSLTSGTLPTGLTLNASTGAITGTPTVSVTNSSLTFQVKDSSTPQQTKSVSLTLTIAPATLTITTTSLPAGQINVAYSTKLAATGGSSPFTWTLTSGALPTGLQLNASTGAIAGTPTVSVTNSSLTFQVKDSSTPQQTKSVSLTLTIAPATLTITTTSLPAGQINVAYSTKLAATGGSSPFTWTLTSGALPTGLQLNASTGAIAGTPTVSVTNSSLTFQVKDSSTPQQTKSVSLTLTIAPATLTITTTSLPAGQINVAYSTKLAATGGSSPFTWTLTSGALPTGLQLNASTGAIAGTPTVSVTNSSLTFQVKDSSTPQQTKSVSLTLTIAPATLTITTTSLPAGQINVAYSTKLAATGGSSPFTWTLTSGALPTGLQLNASTGAIAGTPTVSVTNSSLTFQVKDSSTPQQTKSVSLTLTIAPATLTITTTSLPAGQINVAYSTKLAATGGSSPFTWTLTSGALPTGLQLNASTGAIAGTPTVSVTNSSLTFQVKDSSTPQQTKSVSLTLTIAPATLTITTTSLPAGQINVAYSTKLAATGGSSPFTWTLTSGALPTGLQLNASTGAIAGTPTVSVTNSSLTFQVKDSSTPQQTKSVSLTLTIAPATLTITTTSLPAGQINVAYSTKLAATGGSSPFTWTLTSGALPTGLQLNASTGAIAGTPTVSVTNSSLTFQVKDSSTPQQTKSVSLTLTIAPATLTITTTSLPAGQINVAYSTKLAATGGSSPFTWSLTSGTLPTGLTLNASTGAITGTPTVSVTSTPLTFQVKDSGSPQQAKTVNLTLTIGSGSTISVSISPKRAGVTVNQLLSLTATVTNDIGSAGVNWSVSAGGGLSLQTTSSASFSAATAGVYTVTATSNADGSKTASLTVGVTDLTGVTTYHNNLSRDGTNTQEYALTTATVTTTTFGKLFSCTIDSPAYAQPLWVANLSIGGGVHNVVFVASSRDTVYAFDADRSPCVTYWSVSLLGSGEAYLNSFDVNSADIAPDIGIVGTPVIDLTSSTLYVVSKSKDSGTACTPSSSCHQRLHALNLTDHTEKFGGPYELTSAITVSGNGDGSSNGQVPFNSLRQNQRPGLALVNGIVHISWASHGDNGPYHGWVIGFTANNIGAGPSSLWNSTPNAVSGSPSDGGIWMSGGAPAADSSNNLYFLTGNGAFDADSGGSDYGDSTVKLSTSGSLHVSDYFTPDNQSTLNSGDLDHGSGGAAILVDQPSGTVQHLLIGGGKWGILYLVNRDNMGSFNSNSNGVVQSLNIGNSIFATGAFWNNFLYIAGVNGHLNQYAFNTGTGQFSSSAMRSSPGTFGFPGSTPSVTSLGPSTDGIVWALDNSQYCTSQSPGCGATVLHAYDATNVSTELWNSAQGSGDGAGNAVKFTVPTIANGKVYVPTRTELDVYGLLPN